MLLPPWLVDLINRLRGLYTAPSFHWALGVPHPKKGMSMPLDITLTNEQEVAITAHPVTAAGHPATLDGAVKWSVTSGDCTLTPIDDLSVMIVSGTTIGDSVITAEADADLGTGIQKIMDTVTVHVQHALATNLGLTEGTPQAKP